jgi:putative spermidine/putrescine transport system permease protein
MRMPVSTRTSDLLYRHRWLLAILLLGPPLLWIGVVYVGSLLAFLLNSFYGLDEFSGLIDYRFTLSTFAQLFQRANFDIIARSVLMATAVTLASAVIAFPVAYYAARYARGKWKAFFYLAVMMPLWSSYLVKIYAWKLILAKEGILTWLAETTGLAWLLNALLALPVIGGPSLSISYIGMFLVFVYVWLPYMILPTQAALERVPSSLVEASADLGANPAQAFRTIILPLALPGLIAGSIFTFSLTLGDYITPQLVSSTQFIGNVVYANVGVAGNLPLAAAFATVPILIMIVYLLIARRLGAFEGL